MPPAQCWGAEQEQLVLALWHALRTVWGGFDDLVALKDVARAQAGLPPVLHGPWRSGETTAAWGRRPARVRPDGKEKARGVALHAVPRTSNGAQTEPGRRGRL